jgi:ribosomal protein L16 Arg81 hydroxylase
MNYRPIEIINCLSTDWSSVRDQFHSNYRMNKPLCLSHGANNWPAIEKWKSLEYLNSVITDESPSCTLIALDGQTFLKHELCEVLTTLNAKESIQNILFKNDTTTTAQRMYCRLYLDTQPALVTDLNHLELEAVFLSHFESKNCGIWFSSSGCVTPLHYDLCHGLLIQISGRKRFIFASPDETIYLYPNRNPYSKNQTSSLANLTKWMSGDVEEMRRHPAIDEAQWYIVDLSPGDILYTPPGWWHYVISLDDSISVLLPFDMSPHEQLHPLHCLIVTLPLPVSLSLSLSLFLSLISS